MYLKKLKIEGKEGIGVVREIEFRSGLNLIVDETPEGSRNTGNNVGKTTVLRLIDFCLGAKAQPIYTEPESKKEIPDVKKFLVDNEIVVTLVLVDGFEENARKVVIQRNFLKYSRAIRKIDGICITADEFNEVLSQKLFNICLAKPTFRQIISHNIRCDGVSLSNTLKTLNNYTSGIEYETLHLFMFGCDFKDGEKKQEIVSKISLETSYKKRIEKDLTKSALCAKLLQVDQEIQSLTERKKQLKLNPSYSQDLERWNNVKKEKSRISEAYNQLTLRKSLIEESVKRLEQVKFDIDNSQLHLIYSQAKLLIPGIQKSFDEMVDFHNKMIENKRSFISCELPSLDEQIQSVYEKLVALQTEEFNLSQLLNNIVAEDAIEKIAIELNDLYQQKGNVEEKINIISEIENNLNAFEKELSLIDRDLHSPEKKKFIQAKLDLFNGKFSEVSKSLYNESYAVQFEDKTTIDGKPYYAFSIVNLNASTGKKQGEAACFDLAYIKFAKDEGIPHLSFALNDKKELMHNNQLLQIGLYANANNDVQYVASILKDKLPDELNSDDNIVVRLSQSEKLFMF